MSSWPEPASFHEPLPKTFKFCKSCRKQTPHQIRGGGPYGVAFVCIPCLGGSICYEQERD